jgi:2-oxoglutarate dehydrogenase E1 component
MSTRLDFVQRANAGYIEEMYVRYRRDPASVPEEWALFFAGFEFSGRPDAGAVPAGGLFGLIQHHRVFGHRAAHLDPLGDPPPVPPVLEPATLGFGESDLDTAVEPQPILQAPFAGTLRDLVAMLRETYCGTLGVEFMQIDDETRRAWLEQRMEPARNQPSFSNDDRIRIMRQLRMADAFEEFLHVKYVGQKRFSLEGAAALIPMLDTLVEMAGEAGVEQIQIGMPHRGRLNVLANVMKKPLESMFAEFETGFSPGDEHGLGDVKYHLGFQAYHATRGGRRVHLDLNFNPSHLEFVNPVVLGALRARQDMMGDTNRTRGLAVLIHGDAAFSGEGIVAETLALAELEPYRTGGTVHIVVNNQVGFTTSPEDVRTGRYATDIARIMDAPVFHVNGDNPEAAVQAITLAMDYRAEFHRDVFVDLVCYRKYGHNELDDPTFTQPVMYRKIAAHTPAARRYAARLVEAGVLDEAGVRAIDAEIAATLQEAHRQARAGIPDPGPQPLRGAWAGFTWAGEDWNADTAVPRERLEAIVRSLAKLPEGFHPHRRIPRLLAERVAMLEQDRVDWSLGETLAYGTLLLEGTHVRLSGQDTGRGTFTHRHAVLHDAEDGTRFVPLRHLAQEQGRVTVFDTPLNESASLGFEYGYSTGDPLTLDLWEAQYGDFANVAQVYIDQFIASAEAKWRRMSGLVLLLPHGYEGQGPEHSSARLERFMDLCANGNIQLVNLTTPAQIFHALRRQQHRRFRKPLVIMSPKSLLRHKLAVSPVRELTEGGFRNVIDDEGVDDPRAVRRVVLVSGRFYYTLLEAREERGAEGTALVRVEQLYPSPRTELAGLLQRYPGARDIRWVQEEPANMGAWRGIRHRIEGILPEGASLSLVARKASPTPATGFHARHAEEERQLIDRAFAEVGPVRAGTRQATRPRGA